MGVTVTGGTMPGALTPICNDCGIALCWDVSSEEYESQKSFWDNWTCRDCNPDYEGALKRFKAAQSATHLLPEGTTMAAQAQTLLLVLRYGDHLEPCITEELAIACIKKNLPDLPDEVWDEGEDCEVVNEYDVEVNPNGQVKLLALA